MSIIEEAKKLPVGAAELFCAKNGVEFHPIVCDSMTEGGCKHVSREQRRLREAAYASKVGGVPAEVALPATPEAPVAVVDDEISAPAHIATPPKRKGSGHK